MVDSNGNETGIAEFYQGKSTRYNSVNKIDVNSEVLDICYWVLYTGICQTVCMFGIVTNIINMICFVKQGFRDSVNISLLGLTLSDIGSLVTMAGFNIFQTPSLISADTSFDPYAIGFLATGIPHSIFTRISSWITALITLERCLCIAMPLKVKQIVTTRCMTFLIVCMFLISCIIVIPLYTLNITGMVFIPERNKSILSIIYYDNRDSVERFSFAINHLFLPFLACGFTTVCTAILVLTLRRITKWRMISASATNSNNVSKRNKNVARMVVIISLLSISCYIPLFVTLIVICSVPAFSISGKYKHIAYIVGGFDLTIENINASVNIFIYYRMSSKYRILFRQLFNLRNIDMTY